MKLRNWQKKIIKAVGTRVATPLGQNALSINRGYGDQAIVIRERSTDLYKLIIGAPLRCPDDFRTCFDIAEVLDYV